MGQHGKAGDVPTGIDVRVGGLHVFVYLYAVSEKFDAQCFDAQVFRVGFSSDTDQYLVDLNCLSLSVLFHNHAVGCDFDDFGFKKEFDALFGIFGPQHC